MPLEGRAANCGVPRPAAFERRRCAFEAVDGHQGSIVLRDRAWIDETCINDTDLSHGYGEARKRGFRSKAMLTRRLHVRLRMKLVLRPHRLLPGLPVAPIPELPAHERRPVPDACGPVQPLEPHQVVAKPAGRHALEPPEEVAGRAVRRVRAVQGRARGGGAEAPVNRPDRGNRPRIPGEPVGARDRPARRAPGQTGIVCSSGWERAGGRHVLGRRVRVAAVRWRRPVPGEQTAGRGRGAEGGRPDHGR